MNSIILKPRNAILILLLFSLGLYYHTINAEPLSLDDKGMLSNYNNDNTYSIKQFFLSERKEHYYRPVVLSSFLIDYYIWMDHESGFRLTNILLHSLNAILVYILALQLIQGSAIIPPLNPLPSHRSGQALIKEGKGVVAFFSALLFAVHPINTEAVNFISARTDGLATFFALISFLLWLRYRETRSTKQEARKNLASYLLPLTSCLSYFMAILSKEVALAFPLMIMVYEYLSSQNLYIIQRIKSAFWVLIIFSLPTLLYFYIRGAALSKGDVGMSGALVKIDAISVRMLFDFIISVGFYFKKLLYPFPLNFAIIEINRALYFFVGMICLLSLIVLGLRKLEIRNWNLESFLLWSVLFSLLPSIVISLAPIAWTPYAERYLYLPSVFFCMLLSIVIARLPMATKAISNRLGLLQLRLAMTFPIFVMITITLWFSVATYSRNIVWLSNLTLWEDTVKKSPKFSKARNEYGVALIMKGEIEKAKEQFSKAIELGPKSKPFFNLGMQALRENDITTAEDYFNKGLKMDPEIGVYRKLGYIYEEKAAVPEQGMGTRNVEYLLKAIEYYERAYQMDRNDEILTLKLAVLYRRVNRFDDARAILQKVIKDNPDSYIEKSAKKILDKITESEVKKGSKG